MNRRCVAQVRSRKAVVTAPVMGPTAKAARDENLLEVLPSQIRVAPHHLGTEEQLPILAVPHAGDNPLDVAAAELGGAPTSPSAYSHMLQPSERPSQRHASGELVRVVGRPELWLCGRVCTVQCWDESARRYMLLLGDGETRAPTSTTADPEDGDAHNWRPAFPLMVKEENVLRE